MQTLGEQGAFQNVLTLALAFQKLNHAADNGEFSAMLRVNECVALLDHVERLEADVVFWRALAVPSERRQA